MCRPNKRKDKMSVEIKLLAGELHEEVKTDEFVPWFRPRLVIDMSSLGQVSVEDLSPAGGEPCAMNALFGNDEEDVTKDSYGTRLRAFIPALVIKKIRDDVVPRCNNPETARKWTMVAQMLENWTMLFTEKPQSVVLYGY